MCALYSVGRQQFRVLKKVASGIASIVDIAKLEKRNASRAIDSLIENGLMVCLGGEYVELSEKGKKLLKKIEEEEISIIVPKAWDGIWHIVAYDIPESHKNERKYFQGKLRDLQFTKIQNSIWVFPYDCKEEMAIFAQSLNINQYVIYLNTEGLPQANKLINKYNLQRD